MQRFYREDYDCVVIKIGTFNHDDHNWDHFGDILDIDMTNQYFCTVKKCVSKKRAYRLVELQSYNFTTDRINQLIVLVGERKGKVSKALFKERVTSDFQPLEWPYRFPILNNSFGNIAARQHLLVHQQGVTYFSI